MYICTFHRYLWESPKSMHWKRSWGRRCWLELLSSNAGLEPSSCVADSSTSEDVQLSYRYKISQIHVHVDKYMYAHTVHVWNTDLRLRINTWFHSIKSCMYTCTLLMHDLIIHEMLRKARQHNTTEKQSNTTQLTWGSYFFERLRWHKHTIVCLLGVALTIWATVAAQLAGLESHIQYKATKSPQTKHHKPDKHVYVLGLHCHSWHVNWILGVF